MTIDPSRLSISARENIEAITEGFQRRETNEQIQARIRAINKAAGLLNRKRDDGVGIRDVFLGEALQFLRIGVLTQGFSPGETKAETRARFESETGQRIRDSHLTRARLVLSGEERQPAPQIKFTNLQKSPDPTRAPLSKGPILRQFSYTVGIVNPTTGEIIGGVTVSSNTRRSKADIMAQAAASVGSVGVEAYSDEDDIPDDFELTLLSSLEASETIL